VLVAGGANSANTVTEIWKIKGKDLPLEFRNIFLK
jgi:hypothetical protein